MYYFAYGSNMVLEHMRRLCGRHCFALGPALLADFELGLDLRGYANIRPQSGEMVYGVLYEIDGEALEALDKFEGHPDVFGRRQVTVSDNDGNKREAWVYLEPVEQFGGNQPRMEYFQRVISGASENRLPAAWIARIRALVAGKAGIE